MPELSRPGRRGELIASLVFLGIFALVIVWQQFGLPWVDVLETIPLLDPDLWSFWIPYFLVLIVLEMLFAIAIYAWGWNWWLAVANLVLNVAFVVPALWLFTTGQLINPEALEAIGWPWGDAGERGRARHRRRRDRRRRLGRRRRRHQDGARQPGRRDADARADLTAARSGCGYFGCIRIAPSRRMTSPFSIGFAMIERTSAAYSVGCPSRDGCGTCASSDARHVVGHAGHHRRLEDAGRDRDDADEELRQVAGDRQGHARRPPPFDAE